MFFFSVGNEINEEGNGHYSKRQATRVLTFEEMLLQAAPGHELVDEQPVLVLVAVADQLHQVRVPQLPQEEHFSLHACMVAMSSV